MKKNRIIPKRIKRKNIYTSEWFDLNLDEVRFPSGKIINDYHVLESKFESVVVLMINDRNEICFIKSPRYITQTIELELPAGGVIDKESIEEAAERELLEETGYVLQDAEHVYSFYPSNALSNQKSHIVIGKCAEDKVVKDVDNDEVHEVLWLGTKQIIHLIKKRQIMDGYTLIALLYYFSRLRDDF